MGANKRLELAEKAPEAANADARDDKMDQIRELMFGGVVRDFDRRIKELGDRTESEMARVVADYEDLLPLKHKKDDPLVELPTSMHQAIQEKKLLSLRMPT